MAEEQLVKIPISFFGGMNDTVDPAVLPEEFTQRLENVYVSEKGRLTNPMCVETKRIPEISIQGIDRVVTDIFPVEIERKKYCVFLTYPKQIWTGYTTFNHTFFCFPIYDLETRDFGAINGVGVNAVVQKIHRPRYAIWKDYMIFSGLQSHSGKTICLRPSDNQLWFENKIPWGTSIAVHQNTIFVGGLAGDKSGLKWGQLGIIEFDPKDFTSVGREKGDGITNIISCANGIVVLKEQSIYFIEIFPYSGQNLITDIGCPTGEYARIDNVIMFVGSDKHIYMLNLIEKKMELVTKGRLNNYINDIWSKDKIIYEGDIYKQPISFNDSNLQWSKITGEFLGRRLDYTTPIDNYIALHIWRAYEGGELQKTIPLSKIKQSMQIKSLINNSEPPQNIELYQISYTVDPVSDSTITCFIDIYKNNQLVYSGYNNITGKKLQTVNHKISNYLVFKSDDTIEIVIYINQDFNLPLFALGVVGSGAPKAQGWYLNRWNELSHPLSLDIYARSYQADGYMKNKIHYSLGGTNEFYCGLELSGRLEKDTSFNVDFDLDVAEIKKIVDETNSDLKIIADRYGQVMNFWIKFNPSQIHRYYKTGSDETVNPPYGETVNTLTPWLTNNIMFLLKRYIGYNEYPSLNSPRITSTKKGFYVLNNKFGDNKIYAELINLAGLGGIQQIDKIDFPNSSYEKEGIGALGAMDDTIFVGGTGKIYLIEADREYGTYGFQYLIKKAFVKTRHQHHLVNGQHYPFIPRHIEIHYVLKTGDAYIKLNIYDSFTGSKLLTVILDRTNLSPYRTGQNVIKIIDFTTPYDYNNLPKGFYAELEGKNFDLIKVDIFIQPVVRLKDKNEEIIESEVVQI